MIASSDARPQAIFLMGPTACGKTDLAMCLHDHLPVDIISVDSAMIYRGMDIGTAKPEPEVLDRYPHALVDICDPGDTYSVAEFLRDARQAMLDSAARGRIPLLVGGTMLYFRALLEGLASLPPADSALRNQLLERVQHEGWPALHRELMELDPVTATKLHPNHSHRILRALEVCLLTGEPMSVLQDEDPAADLRPITDHFRVVQLGLLPQDRPALHRRIEARFLAMLEGGLLDEVSGLQRRGDLDAGLPAIRCVGYRQVWAHLAGECSYDEMVQRGIAATRQLAKRQLTWLRGWHSLHQISMDLEATSSDLIIESCRIALKILRSEAIYIGAGPSYY